MFTRDEALITRKLLESHLGDLNAQHLVMLERGVTPEPEFNDTLSATRSALTKVVTSKFTISGIDGSTRAVVMDAAYAAMQYWPNAHLGDNTRREDLRSAFYLMRSAYNQGMTVRQAAARVERDALNHADM